jgi:hypothetical protein
MQPLCPSSLARVLRRTFPRRALTFLDPLVGDLRTFVAPSWASRGWGPVEGFRGPLKFVSLLWYSPESLLIARGNVTAGQKNHLAGSRVQAPGGCARETRGSLRVLHSSLRLFAPGGEIWECGRPPPSWHSSGCDGPSRRSIGTSAPSQGAQVVLSDADVPNVSSVPAALESIELCLLAVREEPDEWLGLSGEFD